SPARPSPPTSTLFPYTTLFRSQPLFRSGVHADPTGAHPARAATEETVTLTPAFRRAPSLFSVDDIEPAVRPPTPRFVLRSHDGSGPRVPGLEVHVIVI